MPFVAVFRVVHRSPSLYFNEVYVVNNIDIYYYNLVACRCRPHLRAAAQHVGVPLCAG